MKEIMETIRKMSMESSEWYYAGPREYERKKPGKYTVKKMSPAVIKEIHKQFPEGTMGATDEIDEWDNTFDGYCLMDGKRIIGFVKVKTDINWITSIEVTPDYRRSGYGHILIELGKKLGGKYLTVAKLNPVARELYEKHGFVLFYEDKTGRQRMKLQGNPDFIPPGDY